MVLNLITYIGSIIFFFSKPHLWLFFAKFSLLLFYSILFYSILCFTMTIENNPVRHWMPYSVFLFLVCIQKKTHNYGTNLSGDLVFSSHEGWQSLHPPIGNQFYRRRIFTTRANFSEIPK